MNEAVRAILDESILGTLATVNEDGSAWATPLHLFYDDEALYWFSHGGTQHSQNIETRSEVSVVIYSPDESESVKGVYAHGVAVKLDEANTEEAKQLVIKRLGAIPAVFEGATAYRLPFGQLDEARSRGNCWYFYS